MTTSHTSSNIACKKKKKAIPRNLNKLFYTAFTIMGVLLWTLGSDKSLAVSQLGIALIFDPFNPDHPYGQRPFYQKAWLIVHLVLVLAGFIWQVVF